MILSKQLLLSSAQVITATALSTNVIDLGVAGTPYDGAAPLNQDIGKGTPVPILIQVVEAFNTLTSLTITIESSANSNMTSSTILSSQTIPLAQLVLGAQSAVQVLPVGVDQRYLAVRYTVAGSAPTLGKITAGISMGNQTNVTGA
jgi:hypothetical protein